MENANPTKGPKLQPAAVAPAPEQALPKCGLVMPISACDGCPERHWLDVKQILTDAVLDAGFDAEWVSASDEVGVIQRRIIDNLYNNPIVVCDVSGKNANVMFELGLRLAFDKPTIIVKDDKTTYSFDTAPIEHLNYPRDLRFADIVNFKSQLADKVRATHHRATTDPKNFTTFLKHFGTFTVAKLDTKEVSQTEYLAQELRELKQMVLGISAQSRDPFRFAPSDLEAAIETGLVFALQQSGHAIADLRDPAVLEETAERLTEFMRKRGVVVPRPVARDRIEQFRARHPG
jgi:hypothetical protein